MGTRIVRRCRSYHTTGLDYRDFDQIAKNAQSFIDEYRLDVLVGTGMSGLILGGSLSTLCKIPFLAIRRSGEDSHDKGPVVGLHPSRTSALRWGFLDDLIESGRTLRRCVKAIRGEGSFYDFPEVILLHYENWGPKGLYCGANPDDPHPDDPNTAHPVPVRFIGPKRYRRYSL